MQCTYCAEPIQDQAIVFRCSAPCGALLYGKQVCAGATATLDGLKGGQAASSEVAAVRSEIANRLASLTLAAEHYLLSGRCSQATQAVERLVKASKNSPGDREQIEQLVQRIGSPEFQAERALEKKLLSLTRSLGRKRPKGPEAKKLRRLAEQDPESNVAKRALRLAERIEIATAGP